MEEKSSDITKQQSSILQDSSLYLYDDRYNKMKLLKKGCRSNSTMTQDKLSFKRIKNNLRANLYEILQKKNNNISQNVEGLPKKSRNKLNYKINTINLSSNLKSNESKIKSDTTKSSSKRIKFIQNKNNSSLSFSKLNITMRSENKRCFQLKNNNRFSVINLKVDDIQKKNQLYKTKTLQDLTLQHLTSNLLLEKIAKNDKNTFCFEKEKIHLPVLNQTFDSDKNIKRKNLNKKEDCKKYFSIAKKKYRIKYSFLENTMNNILHMVNFVNIEKREELYLNVLNQIDRSESKIKLKDYKEIGHELNPEELYKMQQDEKQKLCREKYEQLKLNYILEKLQKIEAKKLLKTKEKKNYIYDYKLKYKNIDWKNKKYESKYKFMPIKNPVTIKKIKLNRKKRFINNNFNIKNIKKNNSGNLSFEVEKYFDKINKESNNNSTSYIFKTNVPKNKNFKQALFNNIKTKEIDYINTLSSEDKNQKKNKEENINRDIGNNSQVIDNNIHKNINNKLVENGNENINIIDNSINFNDNLNGNIGESNHIDYINNNIKKYQIVKAGNIFIQGSQNYEFEIVFSDYNDKDAVINKKNSINFSSENQNISNEQNDTNKTKSEQIFEKRSNEKINLVSEFENITPTKMSKFKNIIFNEEEKNSNINKSKDNHEEINKKGKNAFLNKEQNKDKISSLEKYIKYKEKKLNEQFHQKKFFDNIIESQSKKDIPYKIIYKSLKSRNDGLGKIELNFIGSKPKKYIKYKFIPVKKKNNSQINDEKPKIDLIKKEKNKEKISSKDEKESDEKIKVLEENEDEKIKRRNKKSATFIEMKKKKLKEIQEKKDTNKIDDEISKIFNNYKIFNDVDFNSIQDIEFNKSLLLFDLREKIRNQILTGKCDKSEMEEFRKFEKKLNDYKLNYNLQDKKELKEYALLLLFKFNEFIEFLEIRDKQQMKENRINKFIDDLNYNMHYHIPFILNIKGKRCSARNLNHNLSNLSELTK